MKLRKIISPNDHRKCQETKVQASLRTFCSSLIFIPMNLTPTSRLFKQQQFCASFSLHILAKMRRAKQPSKQLNSEAIRGAVLCYMSPVVSGHCSIISAKCVWNVKERDLSRSWNGICKKRDLCDKAISGKFEFKRLFEIGLNKNGLSLTCAFSLPQGITNAAFFFSAISSQEKKKGSINDESDNSEDDQEASPIPITSSQQLVDGNPTLVNKSLWPAITYWLALTTPNGAPANPLVVHRALLDCGVGVTANQVNNQLEK